MEKELTINGKTFLEFCEELRGKKILNKYGKEIFKFQLFWNGLTTEQVKEKFNLVNRK
jgi:hypothetical protein